MVVFSVTVSGAIGVAVVAGLKFLVVCDQAIPFATTHTAIAAVAVSRTKGFISLGPPVT